jgi:hypothetical protein
VLLLPFYLAGVYPKTFGKTFFDFLDRYSSKDVFELLVYKGVAPRRSAKNLPAVQKRTFRSSTKSEATFQQLMVYLGKTYSVSNLNHLAHVKTIKDTIQLSYLKGEWSLMSRKFPTVNARILLEQAYSDPARAKILASQALTKSGPFAPFKYPEGIIHLHVENGVHQAIKIIGMGTIEGPIRDHTAQVFGEYLVGRDTWFIIGLMGATTLGVVIHGSYKQYPLFRQRTLGYLSAGRTLDIEGNLLYPPVESVISDEVLTLNDSSLAENLPSAKNILSKTADMVFPEMEENLSFVQSYNNSFSEVSSNLLEIDQQEE